MGSKQRVKKGVYPIYLWPFLGFTISVISALFGIGGGPLTVPTLYILLNIPLKKAIGTSAANGFFITITGALAYIFLGYTKQIDQPNMIGYIYIPAFLICGISGLFFAPIGARLAHQVSEKKLSRIFGIGIICLGLTVIFLRFYP